MQTTDQSTKQRTHWVDYAKALCIIAVVSMYATSYVEETMQAEGWMSYFVKFAQPFRMPDFFFLSGLFVASVIDRPWRKYLDAKAVHFLYFYTLWVTIKFILFDFQDVPVGSNWIEILYHFANYFHNPGGPIWFIFDLALYFIVVKLTKSIPVAIVFIIGLMLRHTDPQSGWIMIDHFGRYFIFFYSGHILAKFVFQFAKWASMHIGLTITLFIAWFVIHTTWVWSTFSNAPGTQLIGAYAGALAVILLAVLLEKCSWMKWIQYLGANSIVIYLAYIIPMFTLPQLIVKYHLINDVGTATLFTVIASVLIPILLFWAVRHTPFRFLFMRPAWVSILPTRTTIEKEVNIPS